MWTPTDHWLEITIETLGRWEGWLARGALRGEKQLRERVLHPFPPFFHQILLNIASVFHDEAFRQEEEGVVICQMRLLIRIGETCQINLNGAEL